MARSNWRLSAWRAWLAPAVVLLAATAAWACSTPVFRYALERWQPDAYEAVLVSRGPLTPDLKALADRLRAASAAKPPLNLAVRTVDASTPAGAEDGAVKLAGDITQAQIVLYFPLHGGARRRAWAAPLTAASVDAMLDSPARREVGKRLMTGDSVVWVFLETGDAKADDAALTQLQKTLTQAERELSAQAAAPPDAAAGDLAADLSKVKIRFSVLKIAHNDPKERFLAQTLMQTEEGLDPAKPTVFPVFGQGRALYAIAGRGINDSNVGAAISFLTGACSCEVKAQNPGVDVLMATDWVIPEEQRVVPGGGDVDLRSLASLAEGEKSDGAAASPAPEAPSLAPMAPAIVAQPSESTGVGIGLSVVVLAVLAGVAVVVIGAVLTRGRGGGAA